MAAILHPIVLSMPTKKSGWTFVTGLGLVADVLGGWAVSVRGLDAGGAAVPRRPQNALRRFHVIGVQEVIDIVAQDHIRHEGTDGIHDLQAPLRSQQQWIVSVVEAIDGRSQNPCRSFHFFLADGLDHADRRGGSCAHRAGDSSSSP